jgi:hypothetical protein
VIKVEGLLTNVDAGTSTRPCSPRAAREERRAGRRLDDARAIDLIGIDQYGGVSGCLSRNLSGYRK